MSANETGRAPIVAPLSEVERQLLTAYVAGAGHDLHDLLQRDDEEAKALLTAASRYASEKLSEIESRWRYLHELRGEE